MKVCKFGGTSVANAEQLRRVLGIVEADSARQVIVPSAPGKRDSEDTKITDLLYLAHELGSKGVSIESAWSRVAERFEQLVSDLGIDCPLEDVLANTAETISQGSSADFAASRGEAINGRVVAALLDAEYVDAAEVIRFSRPGKLDPITYELIRQRCQSTGKPNGRFVIPGFYGALDDGTIVTFSRGGSDVTGAIVANALDADCYENWTDVSGVLVTDPRVVSEAETIAEVTYKELRELAYMGASVLHDEAVFPVRAKGIPINIRNTNRPEDDGTMIVADRVATDQPIVGIAGTKGFTVFYIEKALMNTEIGFGRRVLDVFERLGISYEHTPSGIDTMSIVVADDVLRGHADDVVNDLKAAVNPDTVSILPGMALIATVGKGMNHNIGIAGRLFTALADASINIRMIDQGSSEQNIIIGVEEADLPRAIQTLYAAVFR